jgi:N-acetyl sugar amidotransferase
MDTSDPEITFDRDGVCSHCHYFERVAKYYWFPNEDGRAQLQQIVADLKEAGRGRDYDCIIGLSGGIDSSYLAYWARTEANLRLLAVHVDAGWNSELAVKNIESIVRHLNIDLHTHVVDWQEMRDLQLAFFRSNVANQDTPQDHVFFAALYGFAVKNNVRHVLNGSNLATECILPSAWGYCAMDLSQVRDIHRRFSTRPLKTLPQMSFFDYFIYYPHIRKMKIVCPLNYMPYRKEDAIRTLESELGWRNYGGKHYESRFTKFFQGYWLPTKFGYDKRRAHLSSLIVSGQLTREAALRELQKPAYSPAEIQEDKEYVCKKLGISVAEFDRLMAEPNKSYQDYANHEWKRNWLQKAVSARVRVRQYAAMGKKFAGRVHGRLRRLSGLRKAA